MSEKPRLITLLVTVLIMGACKDDPPPFPLAGSWSAEALIVSDSLWDVETSPVSLDLGKDGRYRLQWYGNRSESGQWRVDHPQLHVRPKGQKSRSMEILHIGSDSLSLRGQVGEQETVIAFRKHAATSD